MFTSQSSFYGLAMLEARVERLEHALALSFSTMQTLAERLQSKFGDEFLGSDLKLLVATDTQAESAATFEILDRLIGEGQQPAAARLFRDKFGVTWDEAHFFVDRWGIHSGKEKIRWLRLMHCIRALESR